MFSVRKLRRLHDLCEVTSSKRIFAADYLSEGVPFYRGKEITEKYNGCIEVSTEIFIARSKFEEIRDKSGLPKPGDLLLTSVGTLGSTYVVRRGDEFYFKDGNITWFRNFNELDSTYFNYWLSAPDGRAELKKCTIGSSQSAYTIVLLKGMEIALPSLDEQRRIASILTAYDDLIENNTRRIAILEEMARRLYEEWFVRFRFPGHEGVPMVESELGLVPQGWVAATIGDAASYVNRGLSPKYDDAAACLVINQKCIRNQRLTLGAARRQIKPVPGGKLLQFGDVLINSTGVGTLGRVAQVLENLTNCTADSHVSIVRAGDNCDLDYFGLSLMAQQAYFEAQGVGSTGQTELSRARISETSIVLPPLDVQQQFGKLVRPMRNLAIILQNKNQNLRTTRDLLLPKLISGELDVSTLPEPLAETV
jgi:type I restriction enzyme S subunit